MRYQELIDDFKKLIMSLTNENRELKNKIAELEKEKSDGKDIDNIIEEKVRKSLNDLLREYKCPKDDRYEPYLDDDLSYDPERDGLNWSYIPKRGTTVPYPIAWWGIYPPEWNWREQPTYHSTTMKSNTCNDDLCTEPHTVSKTGEKIEG